MLGPLSLRIAALLAAGPAAAKLGTHIACTHASPSNVYLRAPAPQAQELAARVTACKGTQAHACVRQFHQAKMPAQ